MLRSHRLRTIIYFVTLVGAFTYFLLPHVRHGIETSRANQQVEIDGKDTPRLEITDLPPSVKAVRNGTLGFHQIFVINSPDRSDKLDTFALSSSVTGFTFDVIPRVDGSQVSNKSLPTTQHLPQQESKRNYIVGQWRTHLNFARKILQESLTTALIMSDSSDWSIYLKSQLELFAQGSQHLLATVSPAIQRAPYSPYGDDWDLLWLGHCGSSMHTTNPRLFVVDNDPTVPHPEHRSTHSTSKLDIAALGFDEHTRLIYEAEAGSCVYAYALSNQGAMKFVNYNSNMKRFLAVEESLAALCKGEDGFRCVSVFPTLVDTHTAAGGEREGEEGSTRWLDAHTFNVLHSQQMNVDRALRGEKLGDGREWRQWDEEDVVVGPVRTRGMKRAGT